MNSIQVGITAVKIPLHQNIYLRGDLTLTTENKGLVLFVHGSGSSHKSPRNQFVAKALNRQGFSTLLFDLLTVEEGHNRSNVFNIPLLAERLEIATQWVQSHHRLKSCPIGYFGASTGVAAALISASRNKNILSVVGRGGRPDLADPYLKYVTCPTLLIVGGNDLEVIELNRKAKASVKHCELVIIPGAGHLFEELGTLDEVVHYANDWFKHYLIEPNHDSTPHITK